MSTPEEFYNNILSRSERMAKGEPDKGLGGEVERIMMSTLPSSLESVLGQLEVSNNRGKTKHLLANSKDFIFKRNGKSHTLECTTPGGTCSRRISKSVFETAKGSAIVRPGEAVAVPSPAAAEPSAQVADTVASLIEKMIEYFSEGSEAGIQRMNKKLINMWAEQIGLKDSDFPPGWEEMKIDEFKNIIREAEFAKNNEKVMEGVKEAHISNMKNKRYVGTLEESLSKIPNFKEKLLAGMYELVNRGLDVFTVDAKKLKRKIMAAKERLEKMAGIKKNKEDVGKPASTAEIQMMPDEKVRTDEDNKRNAEVAVTSNVGYPSEKPSQAASSSSGPISAPAQPSGPVNLVPAWGIGVVHRRMKK